MTLDVETLLGHLGIVATWNGPSRKWVAKCPNPDHDDSDPSWSIVDRPDDTRHGSHFCFACKWGGGPWELAAAAWGLSVGEAGERLRKILDEGKVPEEVPTVIVRIPTRLSFELPSGVVIPGPEGRWFAPALEYLEARGVPREQADRWGMGFAIRGRLRLRVVIPVVTEGALRTFSARAIVPDLRPRYDAGKVRHGAQPKRALWGEPAFDATLGAVTVAEGVFSALALERAGAPNPCAMLGSDLTPGRARILSTFERVVIATDPDDAGDAVANWIAILGRRARVARLDLPASPDDMTDEELRGRVKSILHEEPFSS